MDKKEAIRKMTSELSSISSDWLTIIIEAKREYHRLPMWGTLWVLDYYGEEIYNNARVMVERVEDIENRDDQKLREAIENQDWVILGEYVDEEMAGERCVLDKNGKTTAMFIYDIDGEYLIGVNGAGWDFYHGVWDTLYDICGLQWHKY